MNNRKVSFEVFFPPLNLAFKGASSWGGGVIDWLKLFIFFLRVSPFGRYLEGLIGEFYARIERGGDSFLKFQRENYRKYAAFPFTLPG